MNNDVRTVVTYVRTDGTSSCEERVTGRVESLDDRGRPTFAAHLLWGTGEGGVVVGAADQPDKVVAPFFPGPGGHRFMLFTFLPEAGTENAGDSVVAGPAATPGGPAGVEDQMPGLLDVFDPDRPGMHVTDTIDYIYVVSGQLILELDDGEVPLCPGDCVVQRGTTHAWRNRSTEPAVVAAVLVGAQRSDGAGSTPAS
ncbi:MAG TPA: cupin domain-containing protein [Pseudonocardia sp.]|jgi:mannose-6-phosphate isomerase-like protein (cupin superfamily)|nr:cupin domain-containing protein [Urbifossiella sp.]HZZ46268.1 cupin domain-containing protein [Pseudonocardia sp.]